MRNVFSVIIPTYNGERFIGSALESVRQQHSRDVEVIVIDDGSTDGTLDIVNDFARLFPIRIMTPGRTGNWVTASNLGLREAGGEWASFLHQDDVWLPGRMTELRSAIKEFQGAIAFHNTRFIGANGKALGAWTAPFQGGVIASTDFVEHLLVQNFIAIPSVLFRRQAVLNSQGLDDSLWLSADWDLWLRLGTKEPILFVPKMLSGFRLHSDSQTSKRKVQSKEWEEQLRCVLERHLSFWSSTWSPNEGTRNAVGKTARFSIAVNSALSSIQRGTNADWASIMSQFLSLGPAGWNRYLRDSRILQRVSSRMRA